jgi:hypothetical protein
MALQPFVRPWPLLQFLDLFTQSVVLLGREISASHTAQTQNKRTIIHALTGIRTHDTSV